MSLPLTVRFTLTPELASQALRRYNQEVTEDPTWISSLLVWGIYTVGARMILAETLMKSSPRSAQLLVASGISALAVLMMRLSKRRRRGAEHEFGGEVTFRFSEDGVEKRTNVSESRLEWGAFLRCLEADEFFFLFTSESVAEILPKSAFAGAEEFTEFRALLDRKVAKTPNIRKTRPVFYIILAALVGFTLYSAAQYIHPSDVMEVSLEEYLDLKESGSLREVWISEDGEVRADLISGSTLKGKSCSRVRSQLPRSSLGDQVAYERLVRGLPAERVHDARRP